MKFQTTAKGILEASLRDIEEGRWTCKVLANSSIEGHKFEGHFIPKDDPMGCALGLISMHGGHGKETTVTVAGIEFEAFIPAYPNANVLEDDASAYGIGDADEDGYEEEVYVGPASDAVLGARRALLKSIGETDISDADHRVYMHNDALESAEDAARWFREALLVVEDESPVAA
jgi:hypothetical protein